MLTLREYQKEAVGKAISYFQEYNPEPALIVLPTAWGKSVLAAFVANSIPEDEHLLVLQPSKELLEQNYNKYISLCGDEASAGIFSASFGKKQIGRITFATIGSIKELGNQFKELGFKKMLIDEAHLYPRKEESMLGQFLKDSGITQVLGITATPLKLESFSEKYETQFEHWCELIMLTNLSPSGSFFKKILHVGQIQEMTALGYWSPITYEELPFDPSMLKLNSVGSEYSLDSEDEAYKLNNIRNNIYGALDWHKERRHCLVFVTSVDEATMLASEYPESAVISGTTGKKDRDWLVNAFKDGKIRVMFNVGVLSTGFDYTKIDMIVLGFSTASVSKYYQIIGRGVRIDPEKKDCIVVDMGGNRSRFGDVEDIRFIYDNRWRMTGTNNKLLTGIPINLTNEITSTDIQRSYSYPNFVRFLNFGKHQQKEIDLIPMGYRTWLLKSGMQMLTQQEYDRILLSIDNHIRDTRQDPPLATMPNGMYAGKPMSEVPKNHLAYMYNSTIWNETNDSLKRGIELAYGRIPPYFSTEKKSTKK